jgi:hypothetical protein
LTLLFLGCGWLDVDVEDVRDEGVELQDYPHGPARLNLDWDKVPGAMEQPV